MHFPELFVFAGDHVGVAGVACIWIEANSFVFRVVSVQQHGQSFGGPGLRIGIGRSGQISQSLLKILVNQPAQKAEYAIGTGSVLGIVLLKFCLRTRTP